MIRVLRVVIVAALHLALWPVVGFACGAGGSFFLHWISGEGSEPDSGNPWLMIGAMLFAPCGVMIGVAVGLAQAVNTVWDAIEDARKNNADSSR